MFHRKHIICVLGVLSIMLSALSLAEAKSAKVNMLRILREHKVTVVTTEDPAKLERYWLMLGLNKMTTMTPSEFVVKKNKLESNDGDVLFVLDRSKRNIITPLFEMLLPLSSAAISSHEVITFVSKTARNRDSRYANGWEILVTGPDEKWLHDELSHLGEILDVNLSNSTPTKLHWFKVRRLHIVSTEGKQLAKDWIRSQEDRKKQIFDYDFIEANAFSPQPEDSTDLVFLLNNANLGNQSKLIIESLPKDLQSWYASPDSETQIAAMRETTSESQAGREVTAIVASCDRHLSKILSGKYITISSVPESLARVKLIDLSSFSNAAIKIWTGNDSSFSSSLLSDLASKLASELGKSNMGMEFVSKQHTKLLRYAASGFSAQDIASVRQQTDGASALIVLDLISLDTQTNYLSNAPMCQTSRYSPFTEAKPDEPHKPNPEQSIIFRGKKYRLVDGSRCNDPHYKEDLKEYERKYADYPDKLRHWERRKDEYENRRRYHEMDWVVSLDLIESVNISGNLHIYDLRRSSSEAGKELFTCPINGDADRRKNYYSEHRSVRGEDNIPDSLSVPQSKRSVDAGLISEAFQGACRSTAERLVSSALLPSDRPDRVVKETSAPVTGDRPAESKQVIAEGEADASMIDAKDRAIANALSNAIQQGIGVYVQQTTLGSNYEVVKNELLTKADGFATLDEVVSESTRDGILTVKVKATVSNRPLVEKLKALGLTAEWTVGVMVPSSLNGAATNAPDTAAEMAIIQQLQGAGFRVLDDQQRTKLFNSEAAQRAIKGDTKALAALRREFAVDVLVTGTATAEYVDSLIEGDITYYRTRGIIQAKAILTDTGKVLSTASTVAEGIDQTKDLSAVMSLSDMGDRVGGKFVEDIMIAPASPEPFYIVKILNVKSSAIASKLEDALRDVPGIKQVKRQRLSGGTLELATYVRSEYLDLVAGNYTGSTVGKGLGLKVVSTSKSMLQVKVSK